jgi:hypothetical protein
MKTVASINAYGMKPRIPVAVSALFAAIVYVALLMTASAHAEEVGTSQADLPRLVGKFVIHNQTGVTLSYTLKWGRNGAAKVYALESGKIYEHRHSLENNRAPAPYIQYDYVVGDGQKTYKTIELDFGKAGYAGYGPTGYIDEAFHYHFRYSPDGRLLNFFKGRGL